MKKVAVFVEGQGEQVFVRHLLYYLLEPTKFSFECLRLRSENLEEVPYAYENEQVAISKVLGSQLGEFFTTTVCGALPDFLLSLMIFNELFSLFMANIF